ncbi:uncharacterized protein PV07_08773 [Cladophialophora immunda]|uniref:Chromo domain-containing protein n=1 Tax=Cladophialophora immunda TaxID=569365 RepID=A0A0D2AKV4_9EURO|nr:uncharacterized protein PV07_08773 [Cladophialophora immunda]KIW25607.1 hypothetical protein PV07_08773 [Cladophialophora immunda]
MPKKISDRELKNLNIDTQQPLLGKRNNRPSRPGPGQPKAQTSVASLPPAPQTPSRPHQRTVDPNLALAVQTPLPLSPEVLASQSGTLAHVRKIGPFRIKTQFTFGLDLASHIKVHPVISCVHLEPVLLDAFRRSQLPPPPVEVDGEERFVIDRLLKKEKKGTFYRVRWKGYGPQKAHGSNGMSYTLKSQTSSMSLTHGLSLDLVDADHVTP